MIKQMASQANDIDLEGKITLKEYDSKVTQIENRKHDPVNEYVANFCDRRHVMRQAGLD